MTRFTSLIGTGAIVLAMVLPFPSSLHAHGVVYEVKEERAVTILVKYDDGKPMSYAEVKIFRSVETEIEHQNGRTDKNGCFAFCPDQSGEWKIVINDGMGHVVATSVPVKEGVKVDPIRHGYPRWQKIVTGVSVILGLTGLVYFLRARKRTRKHT